MAKQLNVNMSFTADTSQAKAQIADLQHSLQNLSTSTLLNTSNAGFTKSITEATAKVAELRANLEAAINTDTGQLDLSKFSQQLKQSNTTLGQYQTHLMALGPEGTKAFTQLANAVVQAEMPLRQTNTLMSQLWTTLQNTVRWQLTSSLIHGVMRTVSSAFSYVKSLNSALNDIRIRTGASTEQMADFAKYANEAAQSLSSTTLDMTKAALIYYQQGLSDEEAKKRAEITVKMANVTKDSAQEVSQQLTAVWNNFAEGGENLEYYADVMNALGAATASSTDEIATGLEKFAAVAKTAGLSYEYAASALATVAATTRQSAETVGTGLRTVLARIESLKLGETLEDGVDLTKYTTALQTIGVDVLDLNGNLKDADSILTDMAASWQNLTEAQKMATAETVGGIRQYATIMALMENWDFMEKNLDVAKNSEGTLQKQADIYAESWEAAANRVKTSVQSIYQQLLDDQFFTKLLDGFSKFLNIIHDTIDGIGGLKSILLILGTIITTKFATQISDSFTRITQNLMMLTNAGRDRLQQLRQDAIKALSQDVYGGQDVYSTSMNKAYQQQGTLSSAYIANVDKMNELQKETAKHMLDQQQVLIKNVELTAEEAKQAERHKIAVEMSLKNNIKGNDNYNLSSLQNSATTMGNAEFAMNSAIDTLANGGSYKEVLQIFEELKITGEDLGRVYGDNVASAFEKFTNAVQGGKSVEKIQEVFEQLDPILFESEEHVEQLIEKFTQLDNADLNKLKNELQSLKESNDALGKNNTAIQQTEEKIKALEQKIATVTNRTREYVQAVKDKTNAENANNQSLNKLTTLTNSYTAAMSKLVTRNYTVAQSITALASSAMSLGMTMSMVSNAIKTLTNPDTTGLEKLTTLLTTIGFIVPSVMRLISTENVAMIGSLGLKIQGLTAEDAAYKQLNSTMIGHLAIQESQNASENHQLLMGVEYAAVMKMKELGVKKLTLAELEEAIAQQLETTEGMQRLGMSAAEITAMGGKEAAAKKLAIAYLEEAGAAKTAGVASLAAMWPIAAIAAAIAAVVAIIVIFNKVTHQARNNYKDIIEQNKTLKEHTQALTDDYKNLNSQLEQLQSKTDAIQDLTYNTSEWRTSVAEVNKEVQDLVDKYDLIAGEDWFYDSEGIQRLTAAGEEKIQLKAEDLYINAQKVELAADIVEREAQIAAEKEEITAPNFIQFLTGGKYQYSVGQNSLGQEMYVNGNITSEQLDAVTDALISGKLTNQSLADEEALASIDGLDRTASKIISQNTDLQTALISLSNNILKLDETTQAQISAVNLLSDEKIHNAIFGTQDEEGNITGGVSEKYQTDAVRELGQYGQVVLKGYENQFADKTITGEDRIAWAEEQGYETKGNQFKAPDSEEWQTFNDKIDENIREWQAVQAAQADVADNFEEYIKALEEKSDRFWGIADQLKEKWDNLAPSLKKCTEAQAKYNKTLEDETKSDKDIVRAFQQKEKVYADNAEAIQEVRSSLADMYELSEDEAKSILTDDFVVKNAQLIEDALNDDQAAVEELGRAFDKAKTIDFVASLDDSEFNGKKDELINTINNLELDELTINSSLETAPFYDALAQMLYDVTDDANVIESILNSIGFNPEVTYEPVPLDQFTFNDTTGKYDFVDSEGHTHSVTMEAYTGASSAGVINIPIINGSKTTYNGSPSGNVLSRTGGGASAPRSGGGNSGGGGGGGGGGSAPKKAKTQKVEPKEVERYKEITDTIEDLTQQLEQTNTESDRLWGKDRLASMKKANDLLKQQADAYKKKAQQARDFLDIDREALQKTLTATWVGEYENENGDIERVKESFGDLGFTFDEDWDISNYTEIMTKITDIYNARQAYWADASHFADADAQSRYEELYVKPMEEQISLIEDAISKYEETKDVWEENEEAAKEAMREWQDNNFEQLEYKLELKIEIDDSELQKIEYYIEKLSDDFYSAGENLANYMDKIQNMGKSISAYTQQYKDLTDAYNTIDENGNRSISQEAYYEGLQKIQEEQYKQLESLKELDKVIREYYGDTLDRGQEELEKYTDRLEHVNDMLDHYKDVMVLLGKKTDYKLIGGFLDGIAKNSMNNYLAAKSWYEELSRQRAELEEKLSKAEIGTHEYDSIKQQLQDVVEKHEEAENKLLDKTEEVAEAYEAIWENTVESIGHDFEMLVTNGMGYDLLNQSLDRLESRQDEYLTKTNQLFEMDSLLRKLQSDSDKTSNIAAKQRIANFANEMKQLKDKNELSKLDLDIAKARYEQLKAQIALEEAQNAKSTVRLHRDSEGNYGYMYTADQDKVRAAEDELAKANNDLYNIVLEGTNKYSQKSLELTQKFEEEMKDLAKKFYDEKLIDAEEFEQERTRLEQEYGALRLAYAKEYATAYSFLDDLTVSATGAGEAYTQIHQAAILASQDPNFFKNYGDQIVEATKTLQSQVNPLLSDLQGSLGTAEEAIAENVKRSNEWTEAITGEDGLVNAIGHELQDVLDSTGRYFETYQKEIYGLSDAYEDLADKIAGVIAAQAALSSEDVMTPEGLKNLAKEIRESITFEKYASGGYTGSWGAGGKLAILHEKELVLNKQDTENLLMSVDILRRLSSALDLQAMSAGLASISSATMINTGGSVLDQNVTIHAEFPNAVDHTEIEMAFDTLINRASQYAGRRF